MYITEISFADFTEHINEINHQELFWKANHKKSVDKIY